MHPYRLIIAASTLVLLLGMVRGENPFRRYWELTESQQVLESTVSVLAAETQDLKDEITKIENSANYARRVLRDKYHDVDEGETIIFFAD